MGAAAKPKTTDLPIIPKAIPPYLSIQVGEDSFFARYDSMGVADGVGGWSEFKSPTGVVPNPALYSLKIMHYAGCQLEQYDDFSGELQFEIPEYNNVSPRDILERSYILVNADAKKENIIGSTTAMIVVLRVILID
jgi:hypothetical protein